MSKFKEDYYRYTGKKYKAFYGLIDLFINHGLCFSYFLRLAQDSKNKVKKFFAKIILRHMKKRYGLEISSSTEIGGGFYIGHAYNITINPAVILGRNINIHKGVTIGQENRGRRKGVPTLGDLVWIGVNSTIVGNINVGNNVLIAPNSYINFDVPDNSIVIGNPAKIISKENATEEYINRIV